MKIRYLNGEKVCVVRDDLNKLITAYNYKDVVRAVNDIFKQAEISEVTRDGYGDPMTLALIDIAATRKVRMQTISTTESEVIFDDEKTINKTKSPHLKFPRFNASPNDFRGLKVITGGRDLSTPG